MKLNFSRTIRFRILLIFMWSQACYCYGQGIAEEAQEYLNHENYGAALPLLLEQLEDQPEHPLLNYQAGLCYLHARSQKPKAAEYLERAIENSPSWKSNAVPGPHEAPIKTQKLLGDAYALDYKFEHAVKSYEKYKALIAEHEPDDKLLAEVELRTEMCRHLSHYRPAYTLPVAANAKNPCGELAGGKVKSKLSADKKTMIYTVEVPAEKTRKQSVSSRYFEDPEFQPESKDSVTTQVPSRNQTKKHIEKDTVVYAATIGTSFDGQVVLLYKNEDGNGNLYITRLRDNHWATPVKMRKSANRAGWETFESLSSDGKQLYFASDHTGGFGGMDLYLCKMQADGQWSKAVNLGPSVNSAADEVAPFIHADGVTLFFSSNRVKPGSYDIYMTTKGSALAWSPPANVGYPINRDDKDIFQVNADNRLFSASRQKSNKQRDTIIQIKTSTKKKNRRPPTENYLITFSGKQKAPLNMRRGTVADRHTSASLATDILIIDNATGELETQHQTQDRTGHFSFILPSGKDLQVVYQAEGYLPQSEHINLKSEEDHFEEYEVRTLDPLKTGATATLANIFFEENTAMLTSTSKTEIKRIADLMSANPDIEARLESIFFSNRDGSQLKKLGKKRLKTLRSALSGQQIDEDRLKIKSRKKKHVKKKEDTDDKSRVKKRREKAEEIPPVQVITFKITENKNKK